MIVEFESGARAMLELCMFAEASRHQEEISLVGTKGKLEAFAPSHGVKSIDATLPDFRMGVRDHHGPGPDPCMSFHGQQPGPLLDQPARPMPHRCATRPSWKGGTASPPHLPKRAAR